MPPDPFDNEPSETPQEYSLCEEERLVVQEDLTELELFEALLAPRGIKGIVVQSEEDDEETYQSWSILRENLQQLLIDGTGLTHEPPYNPDPLAYVTWEYCRGYADAVMFVSDRNHTVTDPTTRGLFKKS